jgi:predicted hotdog family 3-hydroxylacyl-ACP dehydratase
MPLSLLMPLRRGWIEAHIPHQGRMCLIDEVREWNRERIRCASGGHRAPDHPLRAHGRLGAVCGVEIAAQAMAVHAALMASRSDAKPSGGLLASLRAVRMHVARLDDVQTELICDAVRVAGDGSTALYEFELHAEARRLLSGRAAVVIDVHGWGRA